MKKAPGILFIVILALFFVFSAGCISGQMTEISSETEDFSSESVNSLMQTELFDLQGEVLANIDFIMSEAEYCAAYAGSEDTGALKNRMSEIISEDKNILTAAYIGNDGIIKEIVPESEGIARGDSLLYQDSVVFMNEKKIPFLTDIFELKQGEYSAAVYYPVFSDSRYEGFVSLTFSPVDIFSGYALALKNRTGFEVMALQTDGVILYDPDEKETGNPTFNNPDYEDFPGIISAAEKIVKKWSGSTEYSFYKTGTEEAVFKRLYWTTARTGGNEWKIMVIRDE